MSRSLLMASTATAGAGAGVGSLVINSPKPESQVSYRTTSSQETELIDEEFEEQEEGSKEEVTARVKSEPQLQEESAAPAPVKEPSWWDGCSFYTVKSSTSKTALSSDYESVKSKIKNAGDLKKVEESCKKDKKVYVAKPYGYDWTYRESDQSITWSIVSN
ncbi:hypothetical protein HF1_05070 [Mycoplasma haemofelis str. Langford 1]|uniref:Uncharacterized protein n=1 Tax=Mycoplasma haemofelis (strain Langford 1) TaxID=941640 RepID=E8ZH94_MYCHL|nr:hypothetical protein [Mycoplasma haemofelis]CBY92515.1 hypothetical protein HF1_05070 [Mycoplasma haemofelis str. Langford 1]